MIAEIEKPKISAALAFGPLLLIPAALLSAYVAFSGITVNQALAIAITLAILTLYFYDRFSGSVAAIVFFMIKSFFVRLAFGFDCAGDPTGGFDLLAMTPALLLSALILLEIYFRLSAGERLCPDRSRILLALVAGLSFLMAFHPEGSPLVGLAGFERNILPNMLVLFLMALLVKSDEQLTKLVKVLLALGLVSSIYAIAQYFAVMLPWEADWFRFVAANDGLGGRLTIGLRGIEFRIFSLFYGYMDFFFTGVLIFALALTHKEQLFGSWRKLRTAYFVSWFVILLLSLERMPLLMTLAVTAGVYFLNSSREKRRRIVGYSIAGFAAFYLGLFLAGPFLKGTGADTLIRLAELANPLGADSMKDRMETKWAPALETIKSNPLGVGTGFGSQTRATAQAADSKNYVQPHNELIQRTLETGFLGGFLYLLLLIAIFKDFLRLGPINSTAKAFGIAMAAASVSFWLCGLVNLPFSGTSGLVFWALAGAALGIKDNYISGLEMANQIDNTADRTQGRVMQTETPETA